MCGSSSSSAAAAVVVVVVDAAVVTASVVLEVGTSVSTGVVEKESIGSLTPVLLLRISTRTLGNVGSGTGAGGSRGSWALPVVPGTVTISHSSTNSSDTVIVFCLGPFRPIHVSNDPCHVPLGGSNNGSVDTGGDASVVVDAG